jgi:hypothetical protein
MKARRPTYKLNLSRFEILILNLRSRDDFFTKNCRNGNTQGVQLSFSKRKMPDLFFLNSFLPIFVNNFSL